MIAYRYRAASTDGDVHTGTVRARASPEAVAWVQRRGWIPLQVEPERAERAPRRTRSLPWRGGQRRAVERLVQELAQLLEAGLPLDRALALVGRLAESPQAAALAAELGDRVRDGAALSAAMAAQPEPFDGIALGMVRAGESAGALAPALAALADHRRRVRELGEQVTSALLYPAILLVVSAGSLIALLVFVIPRFEAMFADLGGALPLSTRVVLGAGQWLRESGWLLGGGIAAGWGALRALGATTAGRLTLDRWALRAPVVGGLVLRREAARFSRTLAVLLRGGVPLLEALASARGVVANRWLHRKLADVEERVRAGERLAAALGSVPALPALLPQLATVGEESGRLAGSLEQVAELLEARARTASARLLTVLEPVLIVGMGGLIAAIILSILVAMLGVNDLVL